MRKNVGSKTDTRILEKFTAKDMNITRWLVSCYEHEIMISASTKNLPWWNMRKMLVTK